MRLCPRHRLTFSETPAPIAELKLTARLRIDRARDDLGWEPDHPGVAGVAAYLEHKWRLESTPSPARS
jgi:nucleoside-diphosphate-sugar epimerase